jgi:hypothetical protein
MKGKAIQQCMTHSVYKLPRPVKAPAPIVVILLLSKDLCGGQTHTQTHPTNHNWVRLLCGVEDTPIDEGKSKPAVHDSQCVQVA